MIPLEDVPPKHPDSSKWYWLSWSPEELNGASIVGATWTVPAGLVVDDSQFTTQLTGARISGGIVGVYYEIEVEILTSDNQTLHETMPLEIRNWGH
ncbi:MAG: hypothetical protein AB2604_10645 [Candidatus Thiodiazotropha taylori]